MTSENPVQTENRLAGENNRDYTRLVEQYQSGLLRYLYLLLKEVEAARDAAQETFMRGYRLWLEQPERDGWRPLLYKIATNHALNLLKRQNQLHFSYLTENEKEWEASDTYESRDSMAEIPARFADPSQQLETRLAIMEALQQMPPEAAACLLLHYDQGLSCAEIATIYGLSREAAWQRLSRARRQFCSLYRKEQSIEA